MFKFLVLMLLSFNVSASYLSQCDNRDRLFILSSVQSGYQLVGSDRGGSYHSPNSNTGKITNPKLHEDGVSEFERLVLGEGRIELIVWLQRAVMSQPGVGNTNAEAIEFLRNQGYVSASCSNVLTQTLR